MKKPNLREQFEEETGFDLKDSLHLYGGHDDECYSDKYVEWLETINSEMIDALVEFKRRYSNEVYNQDFHKQVEQALKKAGLESNN